MQRRLVTAFIALLLLAGCVVNSNAPDIIQVLYTFLGGAIYR